jgi:hypothetical protein
VVRFLHDVGTLVHFDDPFGGLQDLVVIDPQWLADVMKSIITFNNKWIKNGMVAQRYPSHAAIIKMLNINMLIIFRELFNWVWRDFPPNLHPALLRMFERFQVSCHSIFPNYYS